MQIVRFTEKWLKDAQRLAMENYAEERAAVSVLPQKVQFPPLEALVQNGLAVAAVENEKLLGFLGAYDPFEPAFCTRTVCGVFSPVHTHAVIPKNRRLISPTPSGVGLCGALQHAAQSGSHFTHPERGGTAETTNVHAGNIGGF